MGFYELFSGFYEFLYNVTHISQGGLTTTTNDLESLWLPMVKVFGFVFFSQDRESL